MSVSGRVPRTPRRFSPTPEPCRSGSRHPLKMEDEEIAEEDELVDVVGPSGSTFELCDDAFISLSAPNQHKKSRYSNTVVEEAVTEPIDVVGGAHYQVRRKRGRPPSARWLSEDGKSVDNVNSPVQRRGRGRPKKKPVYEDIPSSVASNTKQGDDSAPEISPLPSPIHFSEDIPADDEEVCVDDGYVVGNFHEQTPDMPSLEEAGDSGFTFDDETTHFNFDDDQGKFKHLFSSMAPSVSQYGERYMSVSCDKVPLFIKKDILVDLAANFSRTAHQLGWVNNFFPVMPPLVRHAATFVYIVNGNLQDAISCRSDALSPWSHNTIALRPEDPSLNVIQRAKSRTIPVRLEAGRYKTVFLKSGEEALYRLHEYYAVHPRCLRLRKRVYHVSRDNVVIGDIVIIYEYTEDGPPPTLMPRVEKMIEECTAIKPKVSRKIWSSSRKWLNTAIIAAEFGGDAAKADIDGMEFSSDLDVGTEETVVDHGARPSLLLATPQSTSQIAPSDDDSEDDWKQHPFADEILELTDGSRCLRPESMSWVKDKELVLRLLINDPDALPAETMSPIKPAMPPLVDRAGAFCFFVLVENADFRDIANDDLSPWTTFGYHSKTRKIGLVKENDGWQPCHRRSWKEFDVFLYEYTSNLGRCPRLRKRIMYVSMNDCPVGKVCFSYEYLDDGAIPAIDKAFMARRQMRMAGKGTHRPRISKSLTLSVQDQRKYRDGRFANRVHPDEHLRLPRHHARIAHPPYVQEEIVEEGDIGSLEEEVVDIGVDGDESTGAELVLDDSGSLGHPSGSVHPNEVVYFEEWAEPSTPSTSKGQQHPQLVPFMQDDVLEELVPMYGPEEPVQGNPLFASVRYSQRLDCCARLFDLRTLLKKDIVLSWILNDTRFITQRGLLMLDRPQCPPLVPGVDSFVFFVDGRDTDMKLINKDLLSPWSGTAAAPTGSKKALIKNAKVTRYGLEKTDDGLFVNIGSKQSYDPKVRYVLNETYITHFKFTRLRKRVYYVLDREENVVVGNIVIAYSFVEAGPLPQINLKSLPTVPLKMPRPPMIPAEASNSELFDVTDRIVTADGDAICFRVIDMRFIYEKQKLLDYCVNQPMLVRSTGGLNEHMPKLPPLISDTGAYVFFVNASTAFDTYDGLAKIGCDGLMPWSVGSKGREVFIRPKTKKFALLRTETGELTVSAQVGRDEQPEFSLNVYTATLPRCNRLKKRVYYVMQDRQFIGNILVFYIYDEPGPIPTIVQDKTEEWHRPDTFTRRRNHGSLSLANLGGQYFDEGGMKLQRVRVDYCALLDAMRRGDIEQRDTWQVKVDSTDDQPTASSSTPADAGTSSSEQQAKAVNVPTDVIVDRLRRKLNAIFDFASYQLDARSEDEVMDALWRVLLMKDEHRLLQNIKNEYGVEIVSEDQNQEQHDEQHFVDDMEHLLPTAAHDVVAELIEPISADQEELMVVDQKPELINEETVKR